MADPDPCDCEGVFIGRPQPLFPETEKTIMTTRDNPAPHALAMAKEILEIKKWAAEREAADAKRAEDEERAAILATRPDLGAAQLAVLAHVPVAEIRRHLSQLPRVRSAGPTYERTSGGNPTLGRLTPDERSMLASVHDQLPPTGDIVRATRRGTTLEMPMHIPTPTQITNRIKELEGELEAHRAQMAVLR